MGTNVKMDALTIASILAYSQLWTDVETAKQFGVSSRSIRRYRREMDTDTALAALVHAKRNELELGWADDITATIRTSIRWLREVCASADKKDPATIVAVTQAVRVLADVKITKAVMDVKLQQYSQQQDQLLLQDAASNAETIDGTATVRGRPVQGVSEEVQE